MLYEFEQLLSTFEPITLAEMDAVKLQNRVDTKFVLHHRQLFEIIDAVKNKYTVLEIEEKRMQSYRTLYFDTDNLDMYRHHHDEWQSRYKVRCREYLNSGVAFIEVKHKTNKRRTIKKRIPTPILMTQIQAEAESFVGKYYPEDVQQLSPKLLNRFDRITLVSKHNVERLTLDLNLHFEANGEYCSLPNVAIAEVKQQKFTFESDFVQHVREMNIRRMGFSKYCAGIAKTYSGIKQNRFKRRMLHVQKIARAA